jgi:hypothetical protein
MERERGRGRCRGDGRQRRHCVAQRFNIWYYFRSRSSVVFFFNDFLKRKGVTAFATLHVAVARRVASESGPR